MKNYQHATFAPLISVRFQTTAFVEISFPLSSCGLYKGVTIRMRRSVWAKERYIDHMTFTTVPGWWVNRIPVNQKSWFTIGRSECTNWKRRWETRQNQNGMMMRVNKISISITHFSSSIHPEKHRNSWKRRSEQTQQRKRLGGSIETSLLQLQETSTWTN